MPRCVLLVILRLLWLATCQVPLQVLGPGPGPVLVQVHAQDTTIVPVIQGLTHAAAAGLMSDMQLAYGIDTLTNGVFGTGAVALGTSQSTVAAGTGGSVTPPNSQTITDAGIITMTTKTGTQMLTDMANLKADFAVVDSRAQDGISNVAPSLLYFPLFAAPIVITYHLDIDTPATTPLVFNLNTIARIYRGNISMWNDPAIAVTNPGVKLPAKTIALFAQGSMGGANSAFVKTLAANDPDFLSDTGITLDSNAFMSLSVGLQARLAGRLTVVSGYSTSSGSNSSSSSITSTNFIGPSRAVIHGVLSTPYSLGYAYLGNTETYRSQVASMVNPAGSVVQPNVAGTAMTCNEFKPPLHPSVLDVPDVSNPRGGQAWPLVSVVSVVLDSTRERTTCLTKTLALEFILWMLTSDVANDIATSNSYTQMPALFQAQFNLVKTIQQAITCPDGSFAYQSALDAASLGSVATTNQMLTVMTLFFHVHSRVVDDTVDYSARATNSVGAVQLLLSKEVEASFTSPEIILPSLTDSVLLADNNVHFKLLPAYLNGLVPIFNFDPAVVSAAANFSEPLYPLIMTVDLLGNIFASNIYSWLDPRIARLNPGLAQRFRATGMDPTIRPVVCCTAPTAATSNTNRFLTSVNSTSAFHGSIRFPLNFANQIPKMPNNANQRYIQAEYEPNMLGLAMSSYGTIMFKAVTSFIADSASEFQMLPQTYVYDDTTPIADIRHHALTPTQSTLNSCALDTFDSTTLNLVPALSQREDCWPLTYTAQAVIPASYSGAACKKGNHTLALIKWLLDTPALTASATQGGVTRVTDIPAIHDAVIHTLNYIKCDGVTMLITLPVIWALTPAIAQFTLVVAALGWIACGVIFGFMWKHRNTTVFRSASVPSMTLILIGICTLLAGAVALVQEPSITSCSSMVWLGVMGLTLTFAPLFMKTWRIYKIFDRKQLHVVKISNKRLNVLIGAMLLFDLLILSIWQGKVPLGPVTLSTMSGTTLRQSSQCQAQHDAMPFIVLIVVTKSILILFGALMGFTTRKVTTTFNESQTVAWSIYNLIFATIIIIPILIMVNATEDAYILLQLFLVLWVAYCTLILLFAPKILHILSKDDVAAAAEASSSRVSSNGFSFISTAGLTRQMLAKYIVALENQLHDAHIRMRELVGTGASAASKLGGAAMSGLRSSIGGSQLQTSVLEDSPNKGGRENNSTNRLMRSMHQHHQQPQPTTPSKSSHAMSTKAHAYVANNHGSASAGTEMSSRVPLVRKGSAVGSASPTSSPTAGPRTPSINASTASPTQVHTTHGLGLGHRASLSQAGSGSGSTAALGSTSAGTTVTVAPAPVSPATAPTTHRPRAQSSEFKFTNHNMQPTTTAGAGASASNAASPSSASGSSPAPGSPSVAPHGLGTGTMTPSSSSSSSPTAHPIDAAFALTASRAPSPMMMQGSGTGAGMVQSSRTTHGYVRAPSMSD